MKYRLHNQDSSTAGALAKFWPFLKGERIMIAGAAIAITVTSATTLAAPLIISHAVDAYIQKGLYGGVIRSAAFLLGVYLVGAAAMYVQTKLMGTVGQRLLFSLRREIFVKLQSLPLAFFNQNKAGDLISRINNDTDTLNQFFSQSLVQFVSAAFQMVGASACLIFLNFRLGAAALLPAAGVLLFTKYISPWIKKENARSLTATGDMSAEISESLENFKLVAIFNRQDYFRSRFQEVNEENYKTAIASGIANHILGPVYGLAANFAQLAVLAYGIILIANGNLTIGLLIGYLSYVSRFYDPIRQVASIWSTFQTALAGWDRISQIIEMKSDLGLVKSENNLTNGSLLAFNDVSFGYVEGRKILSSISFDLKKGKTYAFVGPTGGGKTTAASLMSRLYDPTSGTVHLDGQDIRSYSEKERTGKIGFILQEPFLFTGTVHDNILYGNPEYQRLDERGMEQVVKDAGLEELLERFPDGLTTPVNGQGHSLSLGQQQLVAFMRAVLRKPDLLILDEATANVDTVTEELLDKILDRLPQTTTKVIIAHRFNTIKNADGIYFVNDGTVQKAGSLNHAVDLLMKETRES